MSRASKPKSIRGIPRNYKFCTITKQEVQQFSIITKKVLFSTRLSAKCHLLVLITSTRVLKENQMAEIKPGFKFGYHGSYVLH